MDITVFILQEKGGRGRSHPLNKKQSDCKKKKVSSISNKRRIDTEAETAHTGSKQECGIM